MKIRAGIIFLLGLCLWSLTLPAEEKAPPDTPTVSPTPTPDIPKTPTPGFQPLDVKELEKKGELVKPAKFNELPFAEKMKAKVSLSFQQKNLLEIAATISAFTGLEIVLDPDITGHPEQLATMKWDLELRDVPLEQALVWLCRYLNSEYRVSGNTVIVFRSYTWLKDEKPAVDTLDVTGLYFDLKGEDILKPMNELIKLSKWFNKTANLKMIPQSGKVLAVLPEKELARLRKLLAEMQKEYPVKGPYSPDSPLPKPLTDDSGAFDLRKKLASEKFDLTWDGFRRAEIVKKIASEKHLNFGLCFQLDTEEERLKFQEGELPLDKALEKLLPRQPQMVLLPYSADSLWIGLSDAWYSRSSESIWETAEARAYPVRELASLIGEQKLIEYLKEKLPKNCWGHPATAIFYHGLSGRLIVVHLPEIQTQVDYHLRFLAAGEYKKLLLPTPPAPPAK